MSISRERSSRRGARVVAATLATAMIAAVPAALAGPPPAVGGAFLSEISAMPAGEWRLVNRNLFSDVWTPASLRPLKGVSNPTPDNIISAWSGFAWDTRRGDLILYGGGHANYSGNDVYRWRSSSMTWERASLPSEIAPVPGSNDYMAIDGADAAPSSAHTYDNNLYLPLLDRFLTFGGANIGSGGTYKRPDEQAPGTARRTGPYLFDPERADGSKVGGTTGSHVKRVQPYPDIVGGHMWSNRDHERTIPFTQPAKHVSGCTAYAEESGVDVVYVGAAGGSGSNPNLYRYTFPSLANPALDTIAKVGAFWNGTGGQTSCGYDPQRRLFVRTGNNFRPFVYWDLRTAGPSNPDARVEVNASIAAFVDWINFHGKQVDDCGLDFDPHDDSFAVWCGGPQVWKLRPPAVLGVSGWTIDAQPVGATGPGLGTGTGVLGKWKYLPGYDVFMALHNATAGNVWIYKPLGWSAPQPGDPVNWVPQVTLTSPAGGSVYTLGDSVSIQASASDVDGTVARVEYLANGSRIGTSTTSPYQFAWTPSAGGSYALQARAIDDLGATAYSATVSIRVADSNAPPTVRLTSPSEGDSFLSTTAISVAATAADADGTVRKVEFFANGTKIGEDTTAPYAVAWTPAAAGAYSLTARATDSGNVVTTSDAVAVTVLQAEPFADVPPTHPLYEYVGRLSARGITAGCGDGNFCPDSHVTREQMAIFIERALGVFTPPTPGSQTFDDVPASLAGYPFIEDLARRGITAGCSTSPPRFCPAQSVTREQMAILIMRALGVFDPPTPAVRTFDDVPETSFAYGFIEAFHARGITAGCAVGYFCPTANVTRGQMAVFLVRAFAL